MSGSVSGPSADDAGADAGAVAGAVEAVLRLEFTIEPFAEGRPGPHVTVAVAALRERGYEVEFGPFGSACDVPLPELDVAVGLLVGSAFRHGATHVNVDVARPDGVRVGGEEAS